MTRPGMLGAACPPWASAAPALRTTDAGQEPRNGPRRTIDDAAFDLDGIELMRHVSPVGCDFVYAILVFIAVVGPHYPHQRWR